MSAQLIQLTNPFRPHINRKVGVALPGANIRRTLYTKGLIVDGKRQGAFIVFVNNKVLLEKEWGYKIQDQDVVTVQHLPRGGGGSNILQLVAMIAIVALSIYTGGLASAAYGATYGAIASAAVMIGGTLLLNMMFPQKASGLGTVDGTTASPTYSISASGNSARILQPIPVLYGREKITPDYASAPYAEIQGSDQYLYQLFMLTQGECQVEQVLVGNTDISNYDGAQMEIIPPYSPVTLFPTNVVSSSDVASQQLYGPNEAGYSVVGPFVTADPGTTANFLAVDVSIPGGLYTVTDSGSKANASVHYLFEYQAVDNNGNPQGPWTTLIENTFTAASPDAIRATHKIAVPAGRYQVRGQRFSNADLTGKTSESLYWDGLKAYLTAPTNYGNCTMLAVILKATNQLSSASSHDINVVATRKLRTWDPVNGWTLTTTVTRNPAWAAADILKNADYGRNLVDSAYNLQKLYTLAQTFDQRGDTFNYYFAESIALWQALQTILKVGRTIPVYYAGLIEFIRNEPQAIPKQMFQPDNVVSNSFSVTYQFAEVDTPDFVQVQFRNEETWQNDSVDCVLPGGTQTKPAQITLDGCTNRDQAWREGITTAAINKLQRKMINLTTELEGMIPQYNDLCQISHDSVGWGYSGIVRSVDKTTGSVQLSENVTFVDGYPTHVIAFRKPDGSPNGPYTCIAAANGLPDVVQLVGLTQDQLNSIYVADPGVEEPTMYQFGPSQRAGTLAVLYSAQPQGDNTVALQFVNYDPNIFAAETGGIIPDPPPTSTLPTPPVLPIIDRVTLEYTFAVGQQTIVCTPANGASYYEYQCSPDNGATWIKLGVDTNPQLAVALAPGNWTIRVRAVGTLPGPYTTITVNVEATTLPLVAISALTTTSLIMGIQIDWAIQSGNGGIADHVEIWQGLTNQLGNAVKYASVNVPTTRITQMDMGPGEVHFYWARVIDTAGRAGPWFNNGVGVLGQSVSDPKQIMDYLTGQITKDQLSTELWTQIENASDTDPIYAAINEEKQQRIDADSAQVSQINTLQTQAGETSAAVQVVQEAQSNLEGELSAQYTIKVQGTANGRTAFAGIAVGVNGSGGDVESEVLVLADRFAVLNGTDQATATAPFIINGGVVYLASAMIASASIDMAKIGNLQSLALNEAGNPLWKLDRSGAFSMNGTGAGNARLVIYNNAIQIFDSNGTLRVAMGQL